MVDECTGPMVAAWLNSLGHEVFAVFEEARGVADEAILKKAVDENWIIITNDKDFGEIIFRERRSHRGVIFLRLADERSANKIAVLQEVLSAYSAKLADRFVTVTESKIRFG